MGSFLPHRPTIGRDARDGRACDGEDCKFHGLRSRAASCGRRIAGCFHGAPGAPGKATRPGHGTTHRMSAAGPMVTERLQLFYPKLSNPGMIGDQMSESLPVFFGTLLRSLRTAAGMTQEELAQAARVS